jgi:hypothetical protein
MISDSASATTFAVKSAVKSVLKSLVAMGGGAAMVVGVGAIDAATAPAQALGLVRIDFDQLAAGTTLSDQFTDQGVTFTSAPTVAPVIAGRYAGATGMNLVPGNVRTQLFTDVVMQFAAPINYFSMLALDSDELLTLKGFYQGQLVASKLYRKGHNWQVYELKLGSPTGSQLFDEVVLDLVEGRSGRSDGGPEFYDNLTFNVVSPSVACH